MDAKKLAELREYYDTHELTEEDFDRLVPAEPVPAEQVMVTYSLRLPKPVMDQVRQLAEAQSRKATALMREWIEQRVATELGKSDVIQVSKAELSLVVQEAVRDALRKAG
ncbi:hypothetical protein JOF53_002821 [Crossiella equi]|uniref:CopG family transcriptional regulator n=1 Tax=Crossiella equi TaxID=130796 RepID=A0ABS5ACL8_9PSEU|nr:CopG family antitoxin [Crossiella equi]MBP2473949.1 hypothetical protein [Crossiella equi]